MQFTNGTRIKEAREARNLTQLELGKRIGISQNHLSQVETGISPAGIKTLKKIADVLDVDIREFLDLGDEKTVREPIGFSIKDRNLIIQKTTDAMTSLNSIVTLLAERLPVDKSAS